MPQPSALLARMYLSSKAPLSQELITCSETDLCKEALAKMVEHQLMCLPVFTPAKELVGIIDMLDVVDLIARLHGDTNGLPPACRYAQEWVDWNQASVKEALHQRKRVSSIVSIRGTLKDAARLMVKTQIHRVLVCDDQQQLTNVVTQSDIVNALYDSLQQIDPAYLNRPISDFHLLQRGKEQEIHSVDRSTKAIEVFRLMAQLHVSAVPVLDYDRNRQLLANISARDIREVVVQDDFPRMLYTQSALEFCERVRAHRDASKAPLLVSLKEHNTLSDVIQTLFAFKIHRVWITNQLGQVAHVLSLSDVLEEVLDH